MSLKLSQKQTDLFHVGLNAADEERVRYTQSGHERMKGVLRRQRKENNQMFVHFFRMAVNKMTILTPSMREKTLKNCLFKEFIFGSYVLVGLKQLVNVIS